MLVRGLTNILPGGENGKHSAAYRLSACEGENLVREHFKKKKGIREAAAAFTIQARSGTGRELVIANPHLGM